MSDLQIVKPYNWDFGIIISLILPSFRETSWEWRFCPWRLNHPHAWHWTSRCSACMWNIGCWVSPWRRQRRPCPFANPQRGRRFTTTLHEVRVGELFKFSFHSSFISNLSLVCLSDLRGWFTVCSTQTVSLYHAGGHWPQPGQVLWHHLCFFCVISLALSSFFIDVSRSESQYLNNDLSRQVTVYSSQWADGRRWGVCGRRTCISWPPRTAAHRK